MNHIQNLKLLYYSGFVEVILGVDKDRSAYAIVHQQLGRIHIIADRDGKLTTITHYSITKLLYNLLRIPFKPEHYDVQIELDDTEYVNTDTIDVASTVLQQLIYYGINDVKLILKTVKRRVKLCDSSLLRSR